MLNLLINYNTIHKNDYKIIYSYIFQLRVQSNLTLRKIHLLVKQKYIKIKNYPSSVFLHNIFTTISSLYQISSSFFFLTITKGVVDSSISLSCLLIVQSSCFTICLASLASICIVSRDLVFIKGISL